MLASMWSSYTAQIAASRVSVFRPAEVQSVSNFRCSGRVEEGYWP